MNTKAFKALALAILVLGTASVSEGQWRDQYGRGNRYDRGMRVPAGTSMVVRLDDRLSSHDNPSGSYWNGTVTQSVMVRGRVAIPAGTPVQGVVTESVQGTHNSKAEMALALRSVDVNGQSTAVNATTEPIIADSHRAKKLGAIAIGAVAGAAVGSAVGDKKGGIIGGLLGGLAGYGTTRHAFRTLVLKEGTELSFTTTEDMVAYRYGYR